MLRTAMTVLEMANFVCGKVNQTEAEDVTACKGFLRRRHEMIYQDQLWRDAVGEYVQTLSPTGYTVTSNWLPAKGVLLLPPDIERVLAVRTDSRALRVRSRDFYYRRDFDSFAKSGTAGEFIRLKPAVWEWETSQLILAKRDLADAGTALTADLADSDGVGVTRTTKTLDEDYKEIGTSDRIEALTKPASSGSVVVGQRLVKIRNDSAVTAYVYLLRSPGTSEVTGLTPAATLAPGETSAPIALDALAEGEAIEVLESEAGDFLSMALSVDLPTGSAMGAVTLTGITGVASAYARAIGPTDVALYATAADAAADTNRLDLLVDQETGTLTFDTLVTAVFSATGTGAVTVQEQVTDGIEFVGTVVCNGAAGFSFEDGPPGGVTLLAADTAARKRQRIRLVEIPTTELTIRVLAKLSCPALSADSDSPAITNVDNCLMAFAQGDMLQRERQYGKANALYQEGVQLLDQLKRSEVIQEAHNLCIQPDGGYASDYDYRQGWGWVK